MRRHCPPPIVYNSLVFSLRIFYSKWENAFWRDLRDERDKESSICTLFFCWTHVHLCGHWYHCFGLLVTSPLGFKARVGSALFEFYGGIHDIHSLRFTSDVTPLPVYNTSIAASHLPHMHVSAEVGYQDLNRWPPAWQYDSLPTRPRRPAHLYLWTSISLLNGSKKVLIKGTSSDTGNDTGPLLDIPSLYLCSSFNFNAISFFFSYSCFSLYYSFTDNYLPNCCKICVRWSKFNILMEQFFNFKILFIHSFPCGFI